MDLHKFCNLLNLNSIKKNKEIINYELNLLNNKFKLQKLKINSDNFKNELRGFLKEYEKNHLIKFSLKLRSLIIKKFYNYYNLPFFQADYDNLDKNIENVIDFCIPKLLNTDEIPKSKITHEILKNINISIKELFNFKSQSEKELIKQVSFRYIFENFIPYLKEAPNNALFIK